MKQNDMLWRLATLFCLLLLGGGRLAAEEPPAAPPGSPPAPPAGSTAPAKGSADIERLKATIDWVVKPKEGPSGSPKDASAATPTQHDLMAGGLAQRFQELGLVKVPGLPGWLQDVPLEGEEGGRARNVLGWLPGAKAGATPESAGEYVVFSAHYDYIGDADAKTAPGADDLGSGLALLLETARLLVAERKAGAPAPPRSILFAAFDLQEQGLRGARGFLSRPPIPLEGCAAMVGAEYVGRSMGDLAPGLWLILGTEHSEELATLARSLGSPAEGNAALLSAYYHVMEGDYVAFRTAKVPHLFLTAGASPDWRRPTDVPERIEWTHLKARTEWCRALLVQLAQGVTRFSFQPEPEPRVEEVAVLRDLVKLGLTALKPEDMPPDVIANIKRFQRLLDNIVASGRVSANQRAMLRNMLVAMSNLRAVGKDGK